MSNAAEVPTSQQVEAGRIKQGFMDRIRHHHTKRPITMVFLVAALLVLVVGGSVAAFIAITNDRAVFKSTINVDNPVKQHILRVDGAGELVATLSDRTDADEDKVRFDLSLLDAEGETLENIVAGTPGQRIKLRETVEPGDYTFIVKSEDELTDRGASYTLKIDYPNDVAAFVDKQDPEVEISAPGLGDIVSETFVLSGTASDETELSQVAVFIEGEEVWHVVEGTTEWQFEIDSTLYANGQKIISVRATDASGNTKTEQTLLNFENDITDVDPDPETDPEEDPVEDDPAEDPSDPPADDTPTNPGSGGGSSGSNGDTFFQDFAGNTGINDFVVGVYHRNLGQQILGESVERWGDNNAWHGGSWTGDHDLSCGAPPSQRQLSSTKSGGVDFNLDQIVYLCRDHMMTSMGDVDGYSILWFSPDQVFDRSKTKTVSWDVNVTDLKARQWWEVSIVPEDGTFLATVDWLAGTAGIDTYSSDSVIIGSGPFGSTVNLTTNRTNHYDGWQGICGTWGLDNEGCESKAIRRTFELTDNGNGTLTIDYGGMFTQTFPGQLPDKFQVYFKDHNYTPDKDGMPVGHTWHWDNISVQ